MSKNRKGVSLMVLTITIIVMVIIAGTIILVLNGSGIIQRANEAKRKTDRTNKEEAANVALSEYEVAVSLGKIDPNKTTATEYVKEQLKKQEIDVSDVLVTEENKAVVSSGALAVNMNIPIGATVKGYTLEEKTYVTDGKEHSGGIGGYVPKTVEQTLTTDTKVKWQYIGIDENGNMLILSGPSSSTATGVTSSLQLSDSGGFLYGPDLLNEICNVLYSSDKGTARSINREDAFKLLDYTGPEGRYTDTTGAITYTNEALTIGEIAEKINYDRTKFKCLTPDGQNSWYVISKYKSDYPGIIPKDSEYIHSEIGKSMLFMTSYTYWLASTCTEGGFNGSTHFDNFFIDHQNVAAVYNFNSNGKAGSMTARIRPIVAINPDVQFTYNSVTKTITLL